MIGYSVPRGTGGAPGAAPPRNKALKAKARPPLGLGVGSRGYTPWNKEVSNGDSSTVQER